VGQLFQSHACAFDDQGNRASLTAGGRKQYTVAYQLDLNNRLLEEDKTQGENQLLLCKDANQKTVNVNALQSGGM